MRTTSLDLQTVQEIGVIGAGGAGFPAYAKLKSGEVDTIILNAAECEPLLHKDKEILKNFGSLIVQTMVEMVQFLNAKKGVIALKKKYATLVALLKKQVTPPVELFTMGDFYPAGDEFILVQLVTGRIIPPGGLPLDVNVVVNNVETVLNIGLGKPVTHSFLTIAGDIANPLTVRIPVGTMISELLTFLHIPYPHTHSVIIGGAMMGTLLEYGDMPIHKTTGGLIVLPKNHVLIEKYRRNEQRHVKIGSSCCDQCALCTDLCPRFLMGHPIQPHLAMRALQMTQQTERLNIGTRYCCECNLCSLFSCPIDLDPKDICARDKRISPRKNQHHLPLMYAQGHPAANFRRVSIKRLMDRLGLTRYSKPAPLTDISFIPKKVQICLDQHIGHAAHPIVQVGESVQLGQCIARVKNDQLGVSYHASVSGRVQQIEAHRITLSL